MKILFIANSYKVLSGGDKIFAQLAKAWISKEHQVIIKTNHSGELFCLSQEINKAFIFTRNIPRKNFALVFSSSYFLEDLLPAVIQKLKNKDIRLITTLYHRVPKWGRGYSGGLIKGFVLWIIQSIALILMKKYSTLILTAMKDDEIYLKKKGLSQAIAIRGAVDHKSIISVANQKKIYEAIFIGRLIHQKNIPDLIDFWKEILKSRPSYRLAVIGEGPLEEWLKNKIIKENLQNRILFFGKLDNTKKIKIIKQSKVFLSLSQFDSGSLALDETLACGIPGIIYDITKNHFPKGVMHISQGNIALFKQNFFSLLDDKNLYKRLSMEGVRFAKGFTWSKIADKILQYT